MTIKVLIADDEPLVRAGIGAVLAAAPGMEVIAHVDTRTAVRVVAQHRPDVVVVDVPDIRVDVITEILAHGADRVIYLPAKCTVRLLRDALLAGAAGCLLKGNAADMLVDVVRAVTGTGVWIDPEIVEKVLRELASLPTAGRCSGIPDRLTPREQEILVLVAQGLSNCEIADRLYISALTVRTHVGRVLMKLGARNRAHAVTTAYRIGLVRIRPAA
jgi:DNA-binding NarL/FixJ family response regulator